MSGQPMKYLEDEEEFCGKCLAGITSSEHHFECVVPEREREEAEPDSGKPMDLKEYDAIRDALTAARFDDKALLPEALDAALQALGVIAVSRGSEDAQFAAQTLRRICQRAVAGVPMYEPQEEVL